MKFFIAAALSSVVLSQSSDSGSSDTLQVVDTSCRNAGVGALWCAAKQKCLRAWEEACPQFGQDTQTHVQLKATATTGQTVTAVVASTPATTTTSSSLYPAVQSSSLFQPSQSSSLYPATQPVQTSLYPAAQQAPAPTPSNTLYPATQSAATSFYPAAQSVASSFYPAAQPTPAPFYPAAQTQSAVYTPQAFYGFQGVYSPQGVSAQVAYASQPVYTPPAFTSQPLYGSQGVYAPLYPVQPLYPAPATTSVTSNSYAQTPLYVPSQSTATATSIPSGPIGGQLDAGGCATGGGYTYCASLSRCVRVWETPCPAS